MEIKDFSAIKEKVEKIVASAVKTAKKFNTITAETLLFEGKFGNLGTKWDDPKPYDLGEQIQQSMTMLVTCYAIAEWFSPEYKYPFEISPAGKNGQDISNEQMTCEIFAAKNLTNNQKLWHDLNAVAVKGALSKFVFCCSPGDIRLETKKRHRSKKYHFDFIVDNVSVDENNCHRLHVTISGKSGDRKYEKQSISIIHVTPCIVHQWIKKFCPSGL